MFLFFTVKVLFVIEKSIKIANTLYSLTDDLGQYEDFILWQNFKR